jgi:hypothetical protein
MAYLEAKTLYDELVRAIIRRLEIVKDQRFCDALGKNIGSWSLKRRWLADLSNPNNTAICEASVEEELASLRSFDILAEAVRKCEKLLDESGPMRDDAIIAYVLDPIWSDNDIVWPDFTKKLDRCCRCLQATLDFCNDYVYVDLMKRVDQEAIWGFYKRQVYTKPLDELDVILDRQTLLRYVQVCDYPRIGKIYQVSFRSTPLAHTHIEYSPSSPPVRPPRTGIVPSTKRRKLDFDHYEEHTVGEEKNRK